MEYLVALLAVAVLLIFVHQRDEIRDLKKAVSFLVGDDAKLSQKLDRVNGRCEALAAGLRDLAGSYEDPTIKPPPGYEDDDDMDVEDTLTHFRVPGRPENDGSGE